MDLFNLITPDTIILTPNRRLAAATSQQYNQLQIQQQQTCWPTLNILPFSSWLDRLWREHAAQAHEVLPVLPSKNQQMILWEKILRQSPASDALLQVTATAELAQSAYELLQSWQVPLTHPDLLLTDDGQAFQQWAQEFEKLYKHNNTEIIIKCLRAKTILAPAKIILLGFTELTPLQQELIKTCQQLGSEIIHYHSTRLAQRIHKINLTDEETEIRTMARWAKAIYDAAPEKKNYLVGCVVPKLEKMRETVLQIFSETFAEKNTFTLDPTLLPFNISAGKNLSAFPVVRSALEVLRLGNGAISLEKLGYLLRSAFLGDAEKEQLRRAGFENKLREANAGTFSLEELLKHFKGSCPLLARRLQEYQHYFAKLPRKLLISEWVVHFTELLKIIGWPGERSLDSQEYQVTQRWMALLEEYQTFDAVLPAQTYTQALDSLTQLTIKTVFQIKTPDAPVQVLGVLEAAELPFTHLWVMGFDDTNWPATPKPNPLLPQRLQKNLQMPHATIERELLYCQQLLQQLKHSASKELILSYPEQDGDIHLRPSTLLNDISAINLHDLTLSECVSPAQQLFAARQLETFFDDMAPPVDTTHPVQGGARIFTLQAACPFKAFAELRLHAQAEETPTLGLRRLDRGIIVHKALELIWQELKNLTTLITTPEEQLSLLAKEKAETALYAVIKDNNNNQRYLNLEIERLQKLILKWLSIESQRPGFTVKMQEKELNATIGGIQVTLRVDRIDAIADGSYLIIDYKTGKNIDLGMWFSERPDEPQLPLYCVVSGDKMVGIAFALVHPDKMMFTGISEKPIDIKGIKLLPDVKSAAASLWHEQVRDWHAVLEKLAEDFLQGVAEANPKNPAETCNYCQLKTFCRVHETC